MIDEVYLFGSMADKIKYKENYIPDIDILVKLKKKHIKKYPKSVLANYNFNYNNTLKNLYKKYKSLYRLGIDIFFTYDFEYYFQLDTINKGFLVWHKSMLRIKRKIKL